MKRLACWINKILSGAVVLILALMALLVFINVVLRYGFNSSINITEEVSRYLFVWLAFLGAILAFNENLHVRVSVLVEKCSPFKQKLLALFTDNLMLYCCYLICLGSWQQFLLNLSNLSPISQIPTGVSYLASLIAGLAIGIILIIRIVANVGVLIKGERQ